VSDKEFELLHSMLTDMKLQSPLYQPTSFWKMGSKIVEWELCEQGVANFRSQKTSQRFFAPLYPALQGELLARKDYEALHSHNIDAPPFTDKVSESRAGVPYEQFVFDGRSFSRSFLNYLLGLGFLKKHVDTTMVKTVLEIGGGFGTLGEILLGDDRNGCFYMNLDIPPVAFVSSYYLQNVFGKDNVADYLDLKDQEVLDIEVLKKQYKAINTCSWQIEKLTGKIDLFVNFISFQEMEPEVVNNYCLHVRRLEPSYVLLRNIKEGKRKKGSHSDTGVKTPILGDDYDTFLPEYELIATDSSIFGYTSPDGFHSELRLYQRKSKTGDKPLCQL
jgi:putative sugar O-methyltransferase